MSRLISDDILGAITVWTEAEGEPYQGKLAVSEVIRRRARTRYMSDGTIAGTVALRYQFSALNDDKGDNARLIAALKIDGSDLAVNDCMRAWAATGALGYQEVVPDAVVFFNPATATTPPRCAVGKNFVKSIGRHVFYRDPPQ